MVAAASGSASLGPATPSALAVAAALPANFTLVRELECFEAKLLPISGKAFVACGPELLVIDGDRLQSSEALSRGLPPRDAGWTWSVVDVAGSWPSAAWLGANQATSGAARAEYYRWRDKRWVLVKREAREDVVNALLPWIGSDFVALVVPAMHDPGGRFVGLGTLAFTPPKFTQPEKSMDLCPVRLRAEAWTVLAPGDVMIAGGQPCDVVAKDGAEVTYRGIAAERFQAGNNRGRFMFLPQLPGAPANASWEVTSLVALSSSEVWLAARFRMEGGKSLAYLASWSGAEFKLEPQPLEVGIERIWLENPGVLWATDVDGTLLRGKGRVWQRVAWGPPEDTSARIAQVWVRGTDDVWIVTHSEKEGRSTLYHGKVGVKP